MFTLAGLQFQSERLEMAPLLSHLSSSSEDEHISRTFVFHFNRDAFKKDGNILLATCRRTLPPFKQSHLAALNSAPPPAAERRPHL